MDRLRWLHLSDFHFGKDNYAQIKLISYIIRHIQEFKENRFIPDIIFITGDLSYSGSKEQFSMFTDELFMQMIEAFDNMPMIYIVPGNHDLDRKKSILAATSLYNILDRQEKFFDPNQEGFMQRNEILNRFENFQQTFLDSICFSTNDIFSEKGYFNDIFQKGNKRIGIVGVNTAWLSNSDKDKENLTPGKFIIEDAVNTIKDCDYKFVLGHHPLSWFQNTQRHQISVIFAKNKIIYLHGHMHKNSGDYIFSADKGFLTLQCGAAFQAREDEVYYNSLLWGELDDINNMVVLKPRKWSGIEQNYILDSSDYLPHAFRKDGTDEWELPISFEIPKRKKDAGENKESKIQVPLGWRIIDKAFINSKRLNPLPEESILNFFDGKEPTYSDIFSSSIPTRSIVQNIRDEFIKCNDDNQIKCTLITGAGGEGKTTILMQVVQMLVEKSNWKGLVLNQPEKDIQLSIEQFTNITMDDVWIIAIDNCTLIAEKLFDLLKDFCRRGRNNVHFLFCARDVDWINCEANKLEWNRLSSFSLLKVRGIDSIDAEKIIMAWAKYGDKGLGKLNGLDISEAKEKLLFASKSEEIGDPDEGALLGAMLATRYGDDLHNHVREMLIRLKSVSLYDGTLLDAFAYIASMHSEKLYYLSKSVLAQLYNCELKEIRKKIVGPLGGEAASAISGDMIYTRHLSIAKSARKILEEEFYYDFDELFIDLTTAAIEAGLKGEYIESFSKWKFISDHFISQNKISLAIRLDKAVLNLDKTDTYIIVHLSKIYRNLGRADLAVNLFRKINYKIQHRSFFCEWALIEANEGNRASSIWLSAIALSDQAERRPIDVKNACINLYSIAYTFLETYHELNNKKYLSAAEAAINIGFKIDKNNSKLQFLYEDNKEVFLFDCSEKEYSKLYDFFYKGILAASSEKEIESLEWIPEAETLSYKRLFSLAGINI